jgi:hypothetical protein
MTPAPARSRPTEPASGPSTRNRVLLLLAILLTIVFGLGLAYCVASLRPTGPAVAVMPGQG